MRSFFPTAETVSEETITEETNGVTDAEKDNTKEWARRIMAGRCRVNRTSPTLPRSCLSAPLEREPIQIPAHQGAEIGHDGFEQMARGAGMVVHQSAKRFAGQSQH